MSETNQVSISTDDLMDVIASMTVESWRVINVACQLFKLIDAGERNRFESHFNWFGKKIEECLNRAGMKLVSLEGQLFDEGMAATALNYEEFKNGDVLVVDRMLEPIIIGNNGPVKRGTVILRRADN
jgi:hypothetical protein